MPTATSENSVCFSSRPRLPPSHPARPSPSTSSPLDTPSSFAAPSTLPAHPLSSPSPGPTPPMNPPFLTLTLIPSSSRSPPPRSASRLRTSPRCHPSLTPAQRRGPSASLLGLARTFLISCSPSAGLTEAGSSCPWISLTGGSRSSRSEPGRIPVTSKISPCDRQEKNYEYLRDYIQRFNRVTLDVPSATSEIFVSAFSQGLVDGIFFRCLMKKSLVDYDSHLVRVEKYINLEEAQRT